MATKTTPKQKQNERYIKELFQQFDKTENGTVSRRELEMGLQCIWGTNPTKKEIDEIMAEMGVKDDQEINFENFRACLMVYFEKAGNTSKESETTILESAFKHFDKDGNGKFNKAELKKMLSAFGGTVSDKEIDELFRYADTNNDGQLHYSEFVKIFVKDMKG